MRSVTQCCHGSHNCSVTEMFNIHLSFVLFLQKKKKERLEKIRNKIVGIPIAKSNEKIEMTKKKNKIFIRYFYKFLYVKAVLLFSMNCSVFRIDSFGNFQTTNTSEIAVQSIFFPSYNCQSYIL